MTWDGTRERRNNPDDHDKLTRLLVAVESHVKNFDKHIEEDKVNFSRIENKIWEHARYIYIGIGILCVLEIMIKVK